jgi:hypothetical protein
VAAAAAGGLGGAAVIVTFRPLPEWPYPATPESRRRSRWTFKASWNDTLTLLADEVALLGGRDVVVGGGWREGDIRKDGMPRADARAPGHPGVEISLDSRHGRLVYATDVCEEWKHNVRSIALGLEALRAVNRYGVTRHGEQYAGWLQLAAGPNAERGRRLVEDAGGVPEALKRHHPDHGGDPADFADVQAYRTVKDGRP